MINQEKHMQANLFHASLDGNTIVHSESFFLSATGGAGCRTVSPILLKTAKSDRCSRRRTYHDEHVKRVRHAEYRNSILGVARSVERRRTCSTMIRLTFFFDECVFHSFHQL